MSSAVRHRKNPPLKSDEKLPSFVHDLKGHNGNGSTHGIGRYGKMAKLLLSTPQRRRVTALVATVVVACLYFFVYRNPVMRRGTHILLNRFWEKCEHAGLFRYHGDFQTDLAADYPELSQLSQHTETFLAELQEVLKYKADITSVSDVLSPGQKNKLYDVPWKSFFLQFNTFIPENCQLTPKSCELVKKVPGIYQAFFSVLEPHVHIPPHWGYWKGFIRYQLALMVPQHNNDKCWIRIVPSVKRDYGVGGRTEEQFLKQVEQAPFVEYHWTVGEAMVFDDTYLHHVMNESDEVRVVLYLDVARKLPWYLDLFNRFALFIGTFQKELVSARQNAVFKGKAVLPSSSSSS